MSLCLFDFHFLFFTLLCHYVPFNSVSMHFLSLSLSPQVAIKIIDKTQLNPNSLQKVIYPRLSPLLYSHAVAEFVYKFMRHNRLSINCVNGKRGMLGTERVLSI